MGGDVKAGVVKITRRDIAAVASPGQTVALRATEPLTPGQAERIRASLNELSLRSGVNWVLLDPILEVAQITDQAAEGEAEHG